MRPNRMKDDLTSAELRLARRRHIFTITLETERGYIVTCNRLPAGGGELVILSQAPECVRPSTARRYGARLVRMALGHKP